jgi:hypothetical protein
MVDDTHESGYPEFLVEYYLLDDGSIGRAWYDTDAEEYIDAEVMGDDGHWTECSPEEILSNGDEISSSDASGRVMELGGTV